MHISHLVNHIFSFVNTNLLKSKNEILLENEFRYTMERERARTDRYGGRFSLVIFEVDRSNGYHLDRSVLMQTIVNRIRPTDEVGWFNKSRLGVILPSTPYKGAQKLAGDICEQIWQGKQQKLIYVIYTYPAAKLNNIDRKLQNRFFEKIECDIQETFESQNKNVGVGECKHLAEGLEPLFEQHLPIWKRALDILGSFLGMLLLCPLFLSIAIIIKIVSPGPVFFKQRRLGYLGRSFTIYKFRTMKVNADSSLHQSHIRELIKNGKPYEKLDCQDPRIFQFGHFLRVTGLDELPQLFNVFRGEMSLIGPRPELPCSIKYCELWHIRRFETKPGLSGLWQVSGKTKTTFNEMMRLDINYIKKRSFWLDVLIILKTFPTILSEARR